jgi:hypothetical protein
MVTYDPLHLRHALERIAFIKGAPDEGDPASAGSPSSSGHSEGSNRVSCPWCGLSGLTALELWLHQPLYHIYSPDRQVGAVCLLGSGTLV